MPGFLYFVRMGNGRWLPVLYVSNLTETMDEKDQPEENVQCPGCNGSGQISFFQGESRFLLTMAEFPECCGTGIFRKRSASERCIHNCDPVNKKK